MRKLIFGTAIFFILLTFILIAETFTKCPKNFYQCPISKTCISKSKLCDGLIDCLGAFDEVDCPVKNVTRPSASLGNNVACNGYSCLNHDKCIPSGKVCDGHKDCPEGDDEINCISYSPICTFTCKREQTKCLPASLVCNGNNDCDDGSDEADCPPESTPPSPTSNPSDDDDQCTPDKFKCYSGKCIPMRLTCNGESDCPDGEDERDVCGRNNGSTPCSKRYCSHGCTDESWGGRCTCSPGYKLLADGSSCEDIDECTLSPTERPCFHDCINTLGGYRCSCFEGHRLISDNKCGPVLDPSQECQPSPRDPFLLISTDYTIEKIHFDCIGKSNPSPLAIKKFWVGSFTYDWRSKTIYAYNIKARKIVSIDMEKGSRKDFTKFKNISGAIDGLTFDGYTGNLYWLVPDDGLLQIAAKDGTILDAGNGGFEDGHRLALNQDREELYIGIFGFEPKILVANLDGSEAREIEQISNIGRPTALFVHKETKKLYWADTILGKIGYVDLSGNRGTFGPKMFIREKMVGIYSMIIHDDMFYITSHDHSLYRVSIFHQLETPSSISIPNSYKKYIDPNLHYAINENYSSPCLQDDKAGCSHICTMVDHRVKCLCPRGYVLSGENRRQCTKIECKADEIMCLDGLKCYHQDARCNSKKDCLDGSDEVDCVLACPEDYERCPGGDCIPKKWFCDGFFDCPNGTDESSCKSKCEKDQFDCGDKCITSEWVCDSIPDCLDGKDEKDC